MKPAKHIKKFYDQLHRMHVDGHINKSDKFAAFHDVEIAIHKLAQAFEQDIDKS